MAQVVDFDNHTFAVEPARQAKETVDWVHHVLKEERDIRHRVPPPRCHTLSGVIKGEY
jgi:hypothetical protein